MERIATKASRKVGLFCFSERATDCKTCIGMVTSFDFSLRNVYSPWHERFTLESEVSTHVRRVT